MPDGVPWVRISQVDARIACSNLGTGYKLVTDSEWVTTARIAELDSTNWDSGVVYSGSMWRGHSDGFPNNALSVSDIDDYYDQTGQSGLSVQRRTLNILGQVLWDLGGNTFELTNDTFNSNVESSLGGNNGWQEWDTIGSTWDDLKPINTSLNSTNGIGQVFAHNIDALPSGEIHAFIRGGNRGNGANGATRGIFTLLLERSPLDVSGGFGFRCSYTP